MKLVFYGVAACVAAVLLASLFAVVTFLALTWGHPGKPSPAAPAAVVHFPNVACPECGKSFYSEDAAILNPMERMTIRGACPHCGYRAPVEFFRMARVQKEDEEYTRERARERQGK